MKFLSIFKGRSGTHGALAAIDSVGFLSSTDYDFPDWVPARDIHTLIEGHDFERRFEALTLLQEQNGRCKLRLGRPLLDIPDVASIRFVVRTYNHNKNRFSNSYEAFEVKIPSYMSDISLYDRPRYYDLQLPKTFDQLLIYQFQGYVLDTNKRIIARLETKRFQIMPFRGYQTFPIEKIFKSPKKHLRWE